MSLDMNTATKTNYSKTRCKLPKIEKNDKRLEGLEIVGVGKK